MTLKADVVTIDSKSDSYEAKGNVRMVRDGYSLLADSVIYNRLTEDATARGGVLLEKGDDILRGSKLRLNLDTQQGELLDADLLVKKTNFRIRGRRVDKTGDKDYLVQGGSFTTCSGEPPSWRFEARQVKVTLDEYASGRDAIFYAGNLPLFYFPYLVFPVMKERQSGLLIPQVGRSSKKGLYLTQPYYYAIDPSQDVTFTLDLQSSRGVGSALDYRYLRGNGSEGSLNAYGIYDFPFGRYRGELNQKHIEFFSPDTVFTSNLHIISDRSYYKDYGEAVGEYNRQYYESTLSIDHKWERYDVTGLLDYVEDLSSPSNDQSLQRLPALTLVGAGQKIGPAFLSLNAGATNFQRVQGDTGARLELHPRLSLYTHPTRELDLSLYGGYQERIYSAFGSQSGTGTQGIGIADAGGALSLPLERIYQGAYRHVLTPAVGYSFVQEKGQDRLPLFDFDDRVLPMSQVTWSISNTVTGKELLEGGIPTYRDLFYLRLSQGYQFTGTRRDLLTLVDEGHHLTDLMLEGRVTPLKNVTFGADGRINPVRGYLSTANLSALATGEKGNEAAFAYRFSRGEVHYLEGRFSYPIVTPFVASAMERYSLDKGGLLESRYALEYRHQCWSVVFSYSERPGNREFMTSFSLTGVGQLGSLRLF